MKRLQRGGLPRPKVARRQRRLGYAFDEIRPMLHARWGSADKVPLDEVEAREAKIKAAKTRAREQPS